MSAEDLGIEIQKKISLAQQLLGKGDINQAVTLVNEVLDLEPENIDALYITAVIQRYIKQPRKALQTLQHLLTIDPFYGRAYQEQGHTLTLLNEPEAATAAYENAVNFNPALHASWSSLVDLYRSSGDQTKREKAQQELERLTQLPPVLLTISSYIHEGKVYKAETLSRDFLQKNPRNVEAMRLLANIGLQLHILDDAEFLLESCLEFAPDFHQARADYVAVLNKRQKYKMALEQAKKLREIEPGNTQHETAYANACVAVHDFDKGLKIYEQLIEQDPNNYPACMHAAHTLKTIGRQEDAVAFYRRAYTIKADYGDAFWSLANLKTYRFTDQELAQMEEQEAHPSIARHDRYHFCFALGKAYEDRQNFVRAYEYYERGNSLKKAEVRYNADKTETEFRLQQEICTQELFDKKQGLGDQSPDPIFIVGLPRSGSTLLEQILASHSMVDGTIELPNILALSYKLNGRRMVSDDAIYPGILNDLIAEQLQEYGKEYIDSTRVYRSDAPFFTDKMPNNFRHIGLIKLILPNAKIIDARRHPMACCFSGFKQLFAEGQEFTYGLEEVGRYYRGYVELMDHWNQVFPGEILLVQYEEVVADLETQVRRILDFCGLPFEQSCVDFHKTERAVQTASSEQVRQPLYKSGLEQWVNFKPYLDPLIEALGPDVMSRYPISD